jgi:hypothetical protein
MIYFKYVIGTFGIICNEFNNHILYTSVVQPLVLPSNFIKKRLETNFKWVHYLQMFKKKSDLGQDSSTLIFLKHFFSCVSFVHFVFMCDLEGCKSFVGWKTSLSLQLSMWSFKTWKWVLKLSLCASLEREKNGSQVFFSHFIFEAKRKYGFSWLVKGGIQKFV